MNFKVSNIIIHRFILSGTKLHAQHFSSPSSRLVENNTQGASPLVAAGWLNKYFLLMIVNIFVSFAGCETSVGLCSMLLTLFSILLIIATLPLSLMFTVKVAQVIIIYKIIQIFSLESPVQYCNVCLVNLHKKLFPMIQSKNQLPAKLSIIFELLYSLFSGFSFM